MYFERVFVLVSGSCEAVVVSRDDVCTYLSSLDRLLAVDQLLIDPVKADARHFEDSFLFWDAVVDTRNQDPLENDADDVYQESALS